MTPASDIRVPANLLENWAEWFPGEQEALERDVLARLEDAERAWDLRSLTPMPGGAVGLVCVATRGSEEVVLKVNPRPRSERLLQEALGLRHWGASGLVVELLDERDADATLLLERIRPGDSLEESGVDWSRYYALLGETARALAATGPAAGVYEITEAPDTLGWREALKGRAEGRELERLLAVREPWTTIHLDLHGGNLLRSGDRWVVIDPKACLADPHAEVWPLLSTDLHPITDARDARPRLEVFAQAAGLDPERLAAWCRIVARAESLTLRAQTGPADQETRIWIAHLEAMLEGLG